MNTLRLAQMLRLSSFSKRNMSTIDSDSYEKRKANKRLQMESCIFQADKQQLI
jgi:hypothetical protein